MRDNDAFADDKNNNKICASLQCSSPSKESFNAGIPLDGTKCGESRMCYQEKCVKNLQLGSNDDIASWSKWKETKCKSNCVHKNANGVRTKKRICRTEDGTENDKCEGDAEMIEFCDTKKCPKIIEPNQFASEQCENYRASSTKLKLMFSSEGKQLDFNDQFPNRGCFISCKMVSSGFFSPVENLGISSPFFPDGTPCNEKKKQFCLSGKCISAASEKSERSATEGGTELKDIIHKW